MVATYVKNPTTLNYTTPTGRYGYFGKGNKRPALNNAKSKTFFPYADLNTTTNIFTKISMIIWDLETGIASEVDASPTWLHANLYSGDYGPTFVQSGTSVHVIFLTRNDLLPETLMYFFHGIFNTETEVWTTQNHLVSPKLEYSDPQINYSAHAALDLHGIITFCSDGDNFSSQGTAYSTLAMFYYKSGVWAYSINDDEIIANPTITDLKSPFKHWDYASDGGTIVDPSGSSVYGNGRGNTRPFSFHPEYEPPTWGHSDLDHILSNYDPHWSWPQDPWHYHPTQIASRTGTPLAISWFCATNSGRGLQVRTLCWSGEPEVMSAVMPNIQTRTTDYMGTEFIMGRIIVDGVYYHNSCIELLDGTIDYYEKTRYYGNLSADTDVQYGDYIFFNKDPLKLDLIEIDANSDGTISFNRTRYYQTPNNDVNATLVRGNSTLNSTVSITGVGALLADVVLVRGQSQITSNVIQFLESYIRATLVRGNSTLSATAVLGHFRKYLTALFSNTTKTYRQIESLHFIMTIDGIQFKMQGFSIRAGSVDSETKISNIVEIRAYLSDVDVATYIPQLGSVYVIIKSIYSFGSTESESVLFEGLLDDIQKKGLDTYSFIKASNTQNASGSSFHKPEKIVTYSATSARVQFDHTIKPNDYVEIDGVLRKALKLTHYNYEGYGSYTEVHNG